MGARDHIYTGKSTFMVELMVRDLPLNLGLTTGCSTDLFGHGIVDTSAHGSLAWPDPIPHRGKGSGTWP